MNLMLTKSDSMKLSQLSFFCAVVEHGTIASAAEHLHCVPSNITTRLRELEEQLGIALFSRERNRLFVTPEGRLLYDRAKTLLALADDANRLFSNTLPTGLLNVGALDAVLSDHLPARIAEYRRQRPEVELNLYPGHSFVLENRLSEGELDVIISDGPIDHPLLESKFAFRETLTLISPESVRTPSPARLAAFELYVFGKDCYYRQLVDHWLAETGIAPRATLEIESYPIMFACVAAGQGIACVPESLALPLKRRYAVRSHALDGIGPSDTYFVWRKHQASALIADFVSIVSTDARG